MCELTPKFYNISFIYSANLHHAHIYLFVLSSECTDSHSIFLQIDVKFKVAATGGYYYPGHLPVLGE